MELTLTGASLNSDKSSSLSSSAAKKSNANANANTNAPQCKSSQCQSHSHSHHSHGHANAYANANASNAQLNQTKKKCCENHSHNHSHSHSHNQSHSHYHSHNHSHSHPTTGYFDVRSVPKEKLTSNPNALMQTLLASIRGSGSFDTFTYLVDLVLEFEKSTCTAGNSGNVSNAGGGNSNKACGNNNNAGSSLLMKEDDETEQDLLIPSPMKWGTPPPVQIPNPNQQDFQECRSCLNNYSAEGHTIAHWCAKRHHDGCTYLQYLVDNVPHINLHLQSRDAVGMRPIHWSCTEGSIPNVAFLLDYYGHGSGKGFSGNNKNESDGLKSTTSGSKSYDSSSPLQATDSTESSTISKNNNDKIDIDIDIINTTDGSSCTPLLIASRYGHADLVAFLIKRGANPYAVDNAGDTAFHWAAYKGSVQVCGLLLHLHCYHNQNNNVNDVNVDIENLRNKYPDYQPGDLYGYMDLQDNFGECPLHLASLRGNIDVVSYLIEEAEQFVERKMSQLSQMKTSQLSQTNMGFGSGTKRSTSAVNVSNGGSDHGDIETGGANANANSSTSINESQSLIQNNNSHSPFSNSNVQQYPAYLLHMTDKNNKTPIELSIKEKQKPTELLLRKYMDKHDLSNSSLSFRGKHAKFQSSLKQFFSVQNWLLWMGLMSEGSGRPPKFILWFAVGNIFAASCLEVFLYAPSVWKVLLGYVMEHCSAFRGSYVGNFIREHGYTGEEMVRLSSGSSSSSGDSGGNGYMALHCATWTCLALTWISLYLVNQTDPGILATSSSPALGDGHLEGMNGRRITNWMQLLIRRLCSFGSSGGNNYIYNSIGGGSPYSARCGSGCGYLGGVIKFIIRVMGTLSSWLCCCFGIANENRRIRRETHSLSMELRRQYDDTLESFASSTSTSTAKRQLCHSCHIVRPLRSKHCRVLNRCILLFDHHCPFVGTTIGLYNYKYFYFFVLVLTVANILFTTTGFLYWKHGPTEAAISAGSAAAGESKEIGLLLVVIYMSLYIMMTGGLSIYHSQLVWNNLTTNEHQNLHKYAYLQKKNADGSIVMYNPFNKGVLKNYMSRFVPGRDAYVLDNVGDVKQYYNCNFKDK